jgi:hypothetical protein
MLTYRCGPLRGRITAPWSRERSIAIAWPLNDNSSSPQPSPAGESASVCFAPTRYLGLAHGQHMDTVMPGHFCGEGRA